MTDLILSDEPEFFAPVQSDIIDTLIGQYQRDHTQLAEISEFMQSHAGMMGYFVDGNIDKAGYVAFERLFKLEPAIKALDAAYWTRALSMTDVLDHMPQKRRDEWHNQLRAWKEPRYREGENPANDLPKFEESIVRQTLESMLAMRTQFLSERVDGIFRGLSGDHVTNRPEGFGKRMIIANVIDGFGYIASNSRTGLINDLRAIIAKFMGRDEPTYSATSDLIKALKWEYGKWFNVDGGALKIRLYMKGTAHIEVHPDMAWRLNAILANLYPRAIPPKFRQKPPKAAKQYELIQKPLPFIIVAILADASKAFTFGECDRGGHRVKRYIENTIDCSIKQRSKETARILREILGSIGGVEKDGYHQFDYDPRKVIAEIVASGLIPDQRSHQFYPTPAELAQIAVDFADIQEDDWCLEPSAGCGAIAELMPTASTTCVEVSKLRSEVLVAKGYHTNTADFIKWADNARKCYDKIVMNPPFDQGRWKAHVEAAAELLVGRGRLVAILPSGAKNNLSLKGFDMAWHGPYENMFSGTSISVIILIADKLLT